MSAKETVLAAVRAMPDETTTEEILRRLSELMSSAIKKPNSPRAGTEPRTLTEAERRVLEPFPIPIAEICRRGQEIYNRDIRALVEPEHKGEVVAIDVISGDYVLGEKSQGILEQLRERHPDAIIYLHRVGYASYRNMPSFTRKH